MTNNKSDQTGAGTALLVCKNTSTDVKFHKLTAGVSSMFPTYGAGPITSAYLMNDNSVVGYCAQTREWLKWDRDGNLFTSFARTRTAAAKLCGQVVAKSRKPSELKKQDPKAYDDAVADRAFSMLDASRKARKLTVEQASVDIPTQEQFDNMFKGRYINLVALTDDARSVSCQVWCNNQEQVDGALAKLQSWCTPDEEKWHGRIVTAMSFDGHTKESRTFVRLNDLSTPFLNAMVEVDLGTAHLIAK
jgi:hypothetical protein